MLKLTTDKHEASRGLSAKAELLVLFMSSSPYGRDASYNQTFIHYEYIYEIQDSRRSSDM